MMELMANKYSVREMCSAFGLSSSGYYGHLKKNEAPRRKTDLLLMQKVKKCFEENRRVYGCDRLARMLRREGNPCGKTRVGRLMGLQGLKAKEKRKYKPQTTRRDPLAMPAPNYLKMIPRIEKINRVWIGDITFIWTLAGWVYLAGILDLFSRRCLGWKAKYHMESSLVTETQELAFFRRGVVPGLIVHDDQGSQYTSADFQSLLSKNGSTSSMSRKGNCYDNATMESFWATLKTECFGDKTPEDLKEVTKILFDYIDGFYNTRRIHSSLGFMPPVDFERESGQF